MDLTNAPKKETTAPSEQAPASSASNLSPNPSTSSTQNDFGVNAPQISLPKGSSLIRGIGEKFAANPVTSTCSMHVPLPVRPRRNDLNPKLSLSYESGAGNGPFVFGSSLPLPSITRKTDKGLPQDLYEIESDDFILSGSEDLMPVMNGDSRCEDSSTYGGFVVHLYRSRIESLFAPIECWTNPQTGGIH